MHERNLIQAPTRGATVSARTGHHWHVRTTLCRPQAACGGAANRARRTSQNRLRFRFGGSRFVGAIGPGPGSSLVGVPLSFDRRARAAKRTRSGKSSVGAKPALPDPFRGRANGICSDVRRRPGYAGSRALGRVPNAVCPPAQRSPKASPKDAGAPTSHP